MVAFLKRDPYKIEITEYQAIAVIHALDEMQCSHCSLRFLCDSPSFCKQVLDVMRSALCKDSK